MLSCSEFESSRSKYIFLAIIGLKINHFQSYLKGHSGLVTAMSWSADDSVLVSCADDGSLYEWDISNRGKRVNELVIKSCSYSDVVLTSKYVRD